MRGEKVRERGRGSIRKGDKSRDMIEEGAGGVTEREEGEEDVEGGVAHCWGKGGHSLSCEFSSFFQTWQEKKNSKKNKKKKRRK